MSLRLFELGYLAFIVLFIGLYSLITPNLTRRDLLFGVTVAPDARSSAEGRRILGRYRLGIVLLTLVALGLLAALYLLAPDEWVNSVWLPLAIFAALALQSIPYFVAYSASRALRVSPSAATPATAPAAELKPAPLWRLRPLGLGAAADRHHRRDGRLSRLALRQCARHHRHSLRLQRQPQRLRDEEHRLVLRDGVDADRH